MQVYSHNTSREIRDRRSTRPGGATESRRGCQRPPGANSGPRSRGPPSSAAITSSHWGWQSAARPRNKTNSPRTPPKTPPEGLCKGQHPLCNPQQTLKIAREAMYDGQKALFLALEALKLADQGLCSLPQALADLPQALADLPQALNHAGSPTGAAAATLFRP